MMLPEPGGHLGSPPGRSASQRVLAEAIVSVASSRGSDPDSQLPPFKPARRSPSGTPPPRASLPANGGGPEASGWRSQFTRGADSR